MQFSRLKRHATWVAGALFCAMAWSAPSQAGDEKSLYKIEGVGVLTCQSFLEARKKQSPIYFRMGGWLNGYLTATQRFLPDTYVLAAWQSTDLLLASIAAKCAGNEKLQFHNVAQLMIGFLHENRLKTSSNVISVTLGDTKLTIFKTVLAQVQTLLAKDGFYDGAVNGEFSKHLAESILSYQKSKKLPHTGLPDQVTLGSLLGSKAQPKK